jgi:5'-nucleotidase
LELNPQAEIIDKALRMRILITNDDGINAPGIDVLEKIASDLTDDVWVVAPEIDNSGASHSLTLSEPLRMRELGKRHYGVKGTPTDCVIMGVRFLLKDKPPDLVISGVNRGQNLADDITYSGTVAGAIQGTLLGVRSIAMSLVTGPAEADQGAGEPLWETPMRHGASLVRKLLQAGWPDGVVLNVNYPNCTPDALKGMCATVQGQRNPDLFRIVDRLDTRGKAYYWIGVERRKAKPPKGTDLWAVRCNLISVTPLCLDYTDQSTRQRFESVLDSHDEHAKADGRAKHDRHNKQDKTERRDTA